MKKGLSVPEKMNQKVNLYMKKVSKKDNSHVKISIQVSVHNDEHKYLGSSCEKQVGMFYLDLGQKKKTLAEFLFAC